MSERPLQPLVQTEGQDRVTQRIAREAAFHDHWASEVDPATTLVDATFEATTALENKHVLEQFGPVQGKRVLDLGCGAGEGAVFFAKRGAHVVGVDVSEGMLAATRELAKHHNAEVETRKVESSRIPAGNQEFDLVYGNGVLHHVDLPSVRAELARVMKPSGTGCFIEPLTYNPMIDVYRLLAGTRRSADETPLKFTDVARFSDYFDEVGHREFWLLTLSVFLKFFLVDRAHPAKHRYWKKIYSDADRVRWFFDPLKRVDDTLLRTVPLLRYLCWNTVITLRRPRPLRDVDLPE